MTPRTTIVVALFAAALAPVVVGQAVPNSPPTSSTVTPSIPKDVLYYHLFRHIGFIEKQASSLRAAAKSASYLEHEYARRIGLTEADNQVLLEVASDCSNQLETAWAALGPTFDQARQGAANAIKQGQLPTTPEALKRAGQNRQTTVISAIGTLQQEMSVTGFSKLDQFVTGTFSGQVKVLARVGRQRVNIQSGAKP